MLLFQGYFLQNFLFQSVSKIFPIFFSSSIRIHKPLKNFSHRTSLKILTISEKSPQFSQNFFRIFQKFFSYFFDMSIQKFLNNWLPKFFFYLQKNVPNNFVNSSNSYFSEFLEKFLQNLSEVATKIFFIYP